MFIIIFFLKKEKSIYLRGVINDDEIAYAESDSEAGYIITKLIIIAMNMIIRQ